MKRTNRILPVYAADISGICSALYELGGMTVMHDASGCNSTYTTHDEPRWYSMDSMVYISALSELEAVMGDDEKLVRDIVDAAVNLGPAFICIGGTPIPMMMGTDFKGIARIVEDKTGIPAFGIAANGMHSYVRGAGEAFRWIVKRFCPAGVKADHLSGKAGLLSGKADYLSGKAGLLSGKAGLLSEKADLPAGTELAGAEQPAVGQPAALKVNILGVTPLDFSLTGNTARLKDFPRSHGMETVGCWAMESGLDELRMAGQADVNLVVSAVGLPAASELKQMYGTPYVVGTPVGRRTSGRLAECIRQAAQTGENQSLFEGAGNVVPVDAAASLRPDLGLSGLPDDLSGRKVLIIGEQVIAGSLRCSLQEEFGADQVRVLCPTEGEADLAVEGDIIDWDEDEVIRAIGESAVVVADPLYRQVCPAGRNILFVDFPHEACSGRMYHSIMRPFVWAPDDSV